MSNEMMIARHILKGYRIDYCGGKPSRGMVAYVSRGRVWHVESSLSHYIEEAGFVRA